MRYKTLHFKMDYQRHDYGDSLYPDINDIEIYPVITKKCVTVNSVNMYACVPETHPAFNIDIWCNVIDQIEADDYGSLRFVYGGDDVISFLETNFPHVMKYYKDQI